MHSISFPSCKRQGASVSLRLRFWPTCCWRLPNNLLLQPVEVGLHEQILLAAALDVLVPDSGGNLSLIIHGAVKLFTGVNNDFSAAFPEGRLKIIRFTLI